MSDNEQRPPIPRPLGSMPPEHQPSGCVTALIGISGVILLLPGLCALIFMGGSISSTRFDSSLVSILLLAFIAGAFGVLMIWAAIRRASRR
ncbi:hypothetical protein [Bradyrhizobium sp.]|uniref:hypothetical protein n=1 Tax=Bradyrhizobium sp. TaxID=376 RepID=UPI001E073C12|nr:hypothetical protein [Bradyrhizobium sp.]MBV8696446.1 hypothetical protein [Bradyrhizobium sp.]MBV9978408.1 hypothetical protein [Bradyrhizobium sp.]